MSYAAAIVLGVLFLLRALVTFAPSPWLWGVDTLAGAPAAARAAGLATFLLGAALAWPRAARAPAGRSGRRAARGRSRPAGGGTAILWSAAGAAFLLVLLVPSRHVLLGDGQTYVSALAQGLHLPGPVQREPLPEAAVSAVHALVGGAPIAAFALTGIALGGLALLLAALIARRAAAGAAPRLAIFSAIALGGGLQLFAAYAEYYAFTLTAGLLFLWCALRWLDRKGPLLAVAISYVLAGLCHAVYLFAAPALLYLAWLAWQRGERRALALALVIAPAFGIGLLVLIHYPFGEFAKEATRASLFLPPLGGRTGRTAYGAFAPAHLVELVDLAALIAPALLVLLPLAVRARGPWTEAQRFAGWLVPGLAFFLLFAQSELGMSRDWDLYVVPVTLVTFALALRVLAPAREAETAPGAARAGALPKGLHLALLATGLATAAVWMQSNHSPRQARLRLERIAQSQALFGPASRSEIWRYLSAASSREGDAEGAIRACVNSIEADPDDRQNYRVLATYRIDQARNAGGSVDDAVARCAQDLRGRRHREECLDHGIALATLMAGRVDLMLRAAEREVAADPRGAEAIALLGDARRRMGQDAEARRSYESALALSPDLPRARIGLATLAGLAGDRPAMLALAADALHRAPWSPQVQEFQKVVASGDTSATTFRRMVYVR